MCLDFPLLQWYFTLGPMHSPRFRYRLQALFPACSWSYSISLFSNVASRHSESQRWTRDNTIQGVILHLETGLFQRASVDLFVLTYKKKILQQFSEFDVFQFFQKNVVIPLMAIGILLAISCNCHWSWRIYNSRKSAFHWSTPKVFFFRNMVIKIQPK